MSHSKFFDSKFLIDNKSAQAIVSPIDFTWDSPPTLASGISIDVSGTVITLEPGYDYVAEIQLNCNTNGVCTYAFVDTSNTTVGLMPSPMVAIGSGAVDLHSFTFKQVFSVTTQLQIKFRQLTGGGASLNPNTNLLIESFPHVA